MYLFFSFSKGDTPIEAKEAMGQKVHGNILMYLLHFLSKGELPLKEGSLGNKKCMETK
jgi:hypothetical protein